MPRYVAQFIDSHMGERAEVVQLFDDLEGALKWLNGRMGDRERASASGRIWALGQGVPLEYAELVVPQPPPPPKVVKGYKLAPTIR